MARASRLEAGHNELEQVDHLGGAMLKAILVCISLVTFGLGDIEFAFAQDRLPPPQAGQFPAGGSPGGNQGGMGNSNGMMPNGQKRRHRRGMRRRKMMGQGGQGQGQGQGNPNWGGGQGMGQGNPNWGGGGQNMGQNGMGDGGQRRRRHRHRHGNGQGQGQGNPNNPVSPNPNL